MYTLCVSMRASFWIEREPGTPVGSCMSRCCFELISLESTSCRIIRITSGSSERQTGNRLRSQFTRNNNKSLRRSRCRQMRTRRRPIRQASLTSNSGPGTSQRWAASSNWSRLWVARFSTYKEVFFFSTGRRCVWRHQLGSLLPAAHELLLRTFWPTRPPRKKLPCASRWLSLDYVQNVPTFLFGVLVVYGSHIDKGQLAL